MNALPDPPAILWIYGTLPAGRRTTLAGTRHPSQAGHQIVRACARAAGAAGMGLVGSDARGSDALAARQTLAGNGKVWLVLGCGRARLSAPQQDLADEVLAAGGGLITEHAPDVPPAGHLSITRARLVAALTDTVVVTQAGTESSTRHVVRRAFHMNRRIGVAVPHREGLEDEWALNRLLINRGGPAAAAIAAHPERAESVEDAAAILSQSTIPVQAVTDTRALEEFWWHQNECAQ